jgi:hypothetical protein
MEFGPKNIRTNYLQNGQKCAKKNLSYNMEHENSTQEMS